MLPSAAPLAAATQPSLPATVAPARLDAFQAVVRSHQNGPGLGQALTNAMDGFGARAAQMQASIRELAARDAAGHAPAPGGVSPPAAPDAPNGGADGSRAPLALMVDSFNFAIEASLVSRAATQFTGAIGTLMKGQ